MRRLAQFVRLRASRVGSLVSRLRAFVSRASCVCLRLFTSRVSNASVSRLCVCSRLSASVVLSRICLASVCVGRLVSHLSRVCLRRSSCLAFVSRRSSCLASVSHLSRVGRLVSHLSRVGRLVSHLSRVGRLVSRLSSCLASVSRLSVCPCECLRELAHFMRRSSFKEFKRFLLSSYYLIMSQCQSIHPIT